MKVRKAALESVARIYSGVNVKKGEASDTNDGIPWIRVENLNNGMISSDSGRLSGESMQTARIAPPGTVLFSRTGTIGKVGFCTEAVAPSNNIIAVEFKSDRIDPLYGMYCLLAFRPEFLAESRGAVYDSLSLSTFRKFEIPVPEWEIQREISEKLEWIRQSQDQAGTVIDTVKNSVHDVFGEYFRQEMNEIEMDKRVRLGELAEIVLSSAGKEKGKAGAGVPYVTTGNLEDWEINGRKVEISAVDPELVGKYGLQNGDIVMNRINQIDRLGRCGIVQRTEENAVFGLNTVRIRVNRAKLNPVFLFVWLTHPYMKHYRKEHAKNSTSFQSSLGKKVLMEQPVPYVAVEKQDLFAQEMEKYFSYVRNGEKIIKTLERLRQINYNKIKALYESSIEEQTEEEYTKNRYWTLPSGRTCFYDLYLECIQVPFVEWQTMKIAQLPEKVEVQFLDRIHLAEEPEYGKLGHIRLRRVSGNCVEVIRMEAVSYEKKSGADEEKIRRLEEGLLSDQQDFGYIRHVRKAVFSPEDAVSGLIAGEEQEDETYSRFVELSDPVRTFIRSLSKFQQAVYEEFLLAMQPLAIHMADRQMRLRFIEEETFRGHGIQDVSATIHLLEHVGILERREGFYLNYYREYKQGEERQLIYDHRGAPIPIDTWVWKKQKVK